MFFPKKCKGLPSEGNFGYTYSKSLSYGRYKSGFLNLISSVRKDEYENKKSQNLRPSHIGIFSVNDFFIYRIKYCKQFH